MLTESNRWFIAALLTAGCMLLYNPLTYFGVEKTLGMSRGKLARLRSTRQNGSNYLADGTLSGFALHTVVFFFLAFAILNLPIMCT
jgi:hypothetical protein